MKWEFKMIDNKFELNDIKIRLNCMRYNFEEMWIDLLSDHPELKEICNENNIGPLADVSDAFHKLKKALGIKGNLK